MTKEQIEHMRYGVEIGEYKQVNEEVDRLLDEREALLDALKDAVYDSDFPAQCWVDAIAKAEAE